MGRVKYNGIVQTGQAIAAEHGVVQVPLTLSPSHPPLSLSHPLTLSPSHPLTLSPSHPPLLPLTSSPNDLPRAGRTLNPPTLTLSLSPSHSHPLTLTLSLSPQGLPTFPIWQGLFKGLFYRIALISTTFFLVSTLT
jgi:hypothetical protein